MGYAQTQIADCQIDDKPFANSFLGGVSSGGLAQVEDEGCTDEGGGHQTEHCDSMDNPKLPTWKSIQR